MKILKYWFSNSVSISLLIRVRTFIGPTKNVEKAAQSADIRAIKWRDASGFELQPRH